MKEIDVENWERKSHYKWFGNFANPCFSLEVRMDITKVLKFCKKNNTSSFATIMFAVCKCLNESLPFRYRILDSKVYEIAYANVAYTISVNDYFVNTRADGSMPYFEFCTHVKQEQCKMAKSGYVQETYNNTTIVNDIYCSCVPWIDFVSAQQPIPDHMPESSCIPRVCWGKYTKSKWSRNTYITMNITASHALVDGQDMARVFMRLQEVFNNPNMLTKE